MGGESGRLFISALKLRDLHYAAQQIMQAACARYYNIHALVALLQLRNVSLLHRTRLWFSADMSVGRLYFC